MPNSAPACKTEFSRRQERLGRAEGRWYRQHVDDTADNLHVLPLRVDDRLRGDIVEGRLLPNQRLIESDIARSMNVSRTTVRSALVRLEHEGLIEHERHRGARVRLVELEEAVEILEARMVLEGLAARIAAQRVTRAEIKELRSILAEMRRRQKAGDLLAVSEENALLHGRLVAISGHLTASRLIGALNFQLVRFQYRTILLPGRSERSAAEHAQIVDAVARRDGDGAEATMRAHLYEVASALRQSQPA
jgi:DNA-binding GntR family transcriptional regulator